MNCDTKRASIRHQSISVVKLIVVHLCNGVLLKEAIEQSSDVFANATQSVAFQVTE